MSTVPSRRSSRYPSTVLHLSCARRTVGVEAALRLPTVMVLVVEDACTVIALRDWAHREPSHWRPWARARWHAEGRRLRAKELRMRELAAQCLDTPD
ncbi:hypothetical protein [Streptomyces cylindrosporus]|uniref:Uncharacterized protein n=1 Tax=Streptomyces cylindrosporus TaxID=2927583 RepID=A0ABS9YNU3_9ACTN|nr:hypothetical protein [Streptomyces cylindrosporus]MCI3278230.1 hypothetical protein [Streptomyces cylindrosporus]